MRLPLLALTSTVLGIVGGCTSEHRTTQKPNNLTTQYRDASPRWSPDGKKIAFLRIFGDRLTQLWVAESDLRNPRSVSPIDSVRWARPPITGRAAPVAPDAPSWSPDGRRIAVSRGERIPFEGKRTIGGTALWAYEADSGTVEPIAVHPAGYVGDLQFYRAPAWSPDGKRIAYMAEGVFGYASLVIHTVGVTRPEEQSPYVDMLDDNGWPAWSPDGRWLAFRHSLFQSESALPVETVRFIAPGTGRSRTVHIKSPKPAELRRVSHLAWSPQGGRLVARQYAYGKPDSASPIVVDSERGKVVRSSAAHAHAVLWNRSTPGTVGAARKPPLQSSAKAVHEGVVTILKSGSAFELLREDGRILAQIPSDDFDVSPNGKRIVYPNPEKQRPAAQTTLQVSKLTY